jgi:hypothetical protein
VENQLPPDSAEPVLGSAPPTSPSPLAIPAPIAPTPDHPVTYRDRGTGLVIFGVGQIILGLLAALMIPFVVLGAFMSRLTPAGGMRPGQYVSGVVTYGFIAALLITLGAGSVQMKRWARALTLVISWYWMIVGVLITVLLTAVLPVTIRGLMQAQQNASGTPSPGIQAGVMAVIITIIIVFCAFFLVLVPIAFMMFYSRKDVELTCRYRDPVERWTDRTPLPVLGASVALFTGSLYSLLVGITTPLFPFFGNYLTGIPATACFVVLAALDIYLAVALFRLQSSGWWIAMIASPIRILSLAITYSRADLMGAYSKMGWSDAQVQMINASPLFRSHVILWWSLISMAIFFAYLLWLKRYFKAPSPPSQIESLSAPSI